MADLYDEFVDPEELTGYGRDAADELAENELTLSRWMPNQTLGDLRYKVETGPAGLLDVADYRAYNAEPTFGRREGIKAIEGTLPPLGRQMTLNEYDQLVARDAEEEVREPLLRDSERVASAIARRVELARADALVNASVTIGTQQQRENGLALKVDFNRSEDHEVTAATLWSDYADADILDELEAWAQVYRDTNGVEPGAILTSRKVVRAMARNEQIRGAIRGDNTLARVRQSDVNDLLEDEGLPPIYTYEASADVFDATAGRRVRRKLIPEHKFLFLPPPGDPITEVGGHMGVSLWGTTVEARLPDYGIEPGEEPGIVVAAFIERKTPVRVDTIGTAIALPVMVQPDLSFVADVLAPTP